MNELKADWNEETHIDNISGEVVVNGTPNFSFTKTYFFPQRTSGSITLEEIAPEGYDLSSIEPLKYFWRRFILETKVPANRFMIDPSADSSHSLGGDDASITREEAAFGRFINRIRAIFREILLKPVWIQVCLYMPELARSEYFKQSIGIVFNEENVFAAAKERTNLKQGVDIINQLYSLRDADEKPIFSMKFLVTRYLGMNDDDLALNEQFKEQEILEKLEKAKLALDHSKAKAEENPVNDESAGNDDFGGDFGGRDDDFGSSDFG